MGSGWSKYVNESNAACASAGAAECLVLAYNERAQFAGVSAFTERPLIGAMNSGFCASFETALNTLIPHFGKIVSGSYVAYTVASLYAELEETRITVNSSRLNRFPRLWFEQVIRAMNKLLISCQYIEHHKMEGSVYTQIWSRFQYKASISEAVDYAISNVTRDNVYYLVPIYHFTAVSFNEQYGYVCLSCVATDNIIKFKKDGISTISISALVNPPTEFGGHGGLFNAGTSGYSLGLNKICDNYPINRDENGLFSIGAIPGESQSNFPVYPIDERYFGYEILEFYTGGIGNFTFVAGS